jgi:indole-3-glycerol phosphate synthase
MGETLLETICRERLEAVRRRRREVGFRDLETAPLFAAPRRSLAAALRRDPAASLRWLCELKKASPSAGPIRPDLDVAETARELAAAGADGFSILTEPQRFLGDPGDLARVREAVDRPLLQKDFFVDEYQVVEARALGADAILLIVAALDRVQLRDLAEAARELGLERLVEIHDARELDVALSVTPEMIGINNRDLRTMEVDLEVSLRLLPVLPPDVVRLSESGLGTREAILRVEDAGADAVLVGEALMRAEDPAAKLRELRGQR